MQEWNEESQQWENREDTRENLLDAVKQNFAVIRRVLECAAGMVEEESDNDESLSHALDHLREMCEMIETTGSFLFRLLPKETQDEKVRAAIEQRLGVVVKDLRFISGGNVAVVGIENPESIANEAQEWMDGDHGEGGNGE